MSAVERERERFIGVNRMSKLTSFLRNEFAVDFDRETGEQALTSMVDGPKVEPDRSSAPANWLRVQSARTEYNTSGSIVLVSSFFARPDRKRRNKVVTSASDLMEIKSKFAVGKHDGNPSSLNVRRKVSAVYTRLIRWTDRGELFRKNWNRA